MLADRLKYINLVCMILCILLDAIYLAVGRLNQFLVCFALVTVQIFIDTLLEQTVDNTYKNLDFAKCRINMCNTVELRMICYKEFIHSLSPLGRVTYKTICKNGGGIDCEKLKDLSYTFPLV